MSSHQLDSYDAMGANYHQSGSPRPSINTRGTFLGHAPLPSINSLGNHHISSPAPPFSRQPFSSAQHSIAARGDAWGGIGTAVGDSTLDSSPPQAWGPDVPSTPSQANSRPGFDARNGSVAPNAAFNQPVPVTPADPTDSSPTPTGTNNQVLPLAIKRTINTLCKAHELSDSQNLDLQHFAKLAITDLPSSSAVIQLMQHAAQLRVINQNTAILGKIERIDDRLTALERAAEKAWKPSKEQLETMAIVAGDLIIKPERRSYCGLDVELVQTLETDKEKYELKAVYDSLPKTTELNKAARNKASRTRAQFRRSLLHGILPGPSHASLENWTYTVVTKYKLGGSGTLIDLRYLVRAALLRHFARANKDMLEFEDAKDPEGTNGLFDDAAPESEEQSTSASGGGGSSKRKSRSENGQPPAKKSRGGQGKQPAGAHFFAALDNWIGELYAKNGPDMNGDAWRQTVNNFINEDHKLHGHSFHFAFPDSRPPPLVAVTNYEAPRGLYANMHA